MSSPQKLTYGSATPITCTLSGLSSGDWRQSDLIDNTTNLYLDYIIQVDIAYPNTPVSGVVLVYMAPSLDGTNFADGATGSDGPFTLNPHIGIGFLYPIQNSSSRWSVGLVNSMGFVPPYFSFLIQNDCPDTFAAGSSLQCIGVKNVIG